MSHILTLKPGAPRDAIAKGSVETEIRDVVQQLADEEDIKFSPMLRKLIIAGLHARSDVSIIQE